MLGKHSVDSPQAREAAGMDERARKNTQVILQAMQDNTQGLVAKFAGVSDSTISRWFAEGVDALGKALAFIGLKIVPSEYQCVSPETYHAYQILAEEHVMQNRARRAKERMFETALQEDPE